MFESKHLFCDQFWTETGDSFLRWWGSTTLPQIFFQAKMWFVLAFLPKNRKAWSHNIETSLPKNGNRCTHFAKFLISNFLKGLTYTAVFIKKQFQCRKEEHCSRQAHFLLKKDWYDLYIMTSKPFKRCDPVYLSLLMLSESHIWQVGRPTWTSGGTNLLNWTGLDSTLEMRHHLQIRRGCFLKKKRKEYQVPNL